MSSAAVVTGALRVQHNQRHHKKFATRKYFIAMTQISMCIQAELIFLFAGDIYISVQTAQICKLLTLKAPLMTAADDIHKYFFIVFQRKLDLMFQVNPLLGRGFT